MNADYFNTSNSSHISVSKWLKKKLKAIGYKKP